MAHTHAEGGGQWALQVRWQAQPERRLGGWYARVLLCVFALVCVRVFTHMQRGVFSGPYKSGGKHSLCGDLVSGIHACVRCCVYLC